MSTLAVTFQHLPTVVPLKDALVIGTSSNVGGGGASGSTGAVDGGSGTVILGTSYIDMLTTEEKSVSSRLPP